MGTLLNRHWALLYPGSYMFTQGLGCWPALPVLPAHLPAAGLGAGCP